MSTNFIQTIRQVMADNTNVYPITRIGKASLSLSRRCQISSMLPTATEPRSHHLWLPQMAFEPYLARKMTDSAWLDHKAVLHLSSQETKCDDVKRIIHFLRWDVRLLFLFHLTFFRVSLQVTSLTIPHHHSFLPILLGHILRIYKHRMNRSAF